MTERLDCIAVVTAWSIAAPVRQWPASETATPTCASPESVSGSWCNAGSWARSRAWEPEWSSRGRANADCLGTAQPLPCRKLFHWPSLSLQWWARQSSAGEIAAVECAARAGTTGSHRHTTTTWGSRWCRQTMWSCWKLQTVQDCYKQNSGSINGEVPIGLHGLGCLCRSTRAGKTSMMTRMIQRDSRPPRSLRLPVHRSRSSQKSASMNRFSRRTSKVQGHEWGSTKNTDTATKGSTKIPYLQNQSMYIVVGWEQKSNKSKCDAIHTL